MPDHGTRESLRVIIAGGGTGGHLYPGLAIAEELRARDKNTEILFVGTGGGLEAGVLPREGYELKTIRVGKLMGGGLKRKLGTLILMPPALIQSLWIIFRFRPNIVVGVGGYAAGPVVLMAAFLGIPTLIHEQNVRPGFTNRVLGRFVDAVAVSFPDTEGVFPAEKTTVTGNPLRKSFLLRYAGSEKTSSRTTLFIIGGSRGARSINRGVMEALPLLSSLDEPVKIIHQTGEADYDEVKAAYSSSGLEAEVRPYFHDVARCYGEADLVLARAGATTLAELMACGKAAILVPYPHAAGGHQEANAMELKRAGAVEVLPDADLNGQLLAGTVKKIIHDGERLKYMESRIASYGRPDAASRVVDMVYDLSFDNSTAVRDRRLPPQDQGIHSS